MLAGQSLYILPITMYVGGRVDAVQLGPVGGRSNSALIPGD